MTSGWTKLTTFGHIREDCERVGMHNPKMLRLILLTLTSAPISSSVLFRLSSALSGRSPKLARLVGRINFVVNGIDIDPRATIGPGVLFQHPQGVVIGAEVVVGQQCTFMGGVVLGTRYAAQGKVAYPSVGSFCYLGTKSSILGGVVLGDRMNVGAHSLVIHSFFTPATLVGVPAQPLDV